MNGCFELSALCAGNTSRIFHFSHLAPPTAARERFSPTFPNISATEIHLHFCCHSNIVKFIYISWTRRRDRCQSNGERTLLSNHITIERLWWFELAFSFSSSRHENYIFKISVRGRAGAKRFGKYCSRFCFRILQISSRFLIELSSI